MAKGTDHRTFVKKGPNGERLTRVVTDAPGSEVDARFDGFLPEAESKPAAASSSTSGGAKHGSSTSS